MSDRYSKKRNRSEYERQRHSSSRRDRYDRDDSRDRRPPSKSTKLDDGRKARSETQRSNTGPIFSMCCAVLCCVHISTECAHSEVHKKSQIGKTNFIL